MDKMNLVVEKDGFQKVTAHFLQRGFAVVLLGGEKERWLNKGIYNGIKGKKPINLTGTTNLREFMAVISLSSLLVCNNSGPLHIAVALDVPTVSLMGPSIPHLWKPWGDARKHIVIRKDLPCSPCNLYYCKRGDHACMENITPEEVIKSAEILLGRWGRGNIS